MTEEEKSVLEESYKIFYSSKNDVDRLMSLLCIKDIGVDKFKDDISIQLFVDLFTDGLMSVEREGEFLIEPNEEKAEKYIKMQQENLFSMAKDLFEEDEMLKSIVGDDEGYKKKLLDIFKQDFIDKMK